MPCRRRRDGSRRQDTESRSLRRLRSCSGAGGYTGHSPKLPARAKLYGTRARFCLPILMEFSWSLARQILRNCTRRSFGSAKRRAFCAIWWTSRTAAISIILPSFAAAHCKSRFPLPGILLSWRSGCAASSKSKLRRSMGLGSSRSAGSAESYSELTFRPKIGARF